VAHGLDRIYPYVHRNIAKEIEEQGGMLTEFTSGTKPDRENFPKRNRIVAGLSEATIVVEAAKKGGALITAELASSYNRDVFAVPGRLTDKFSEGCNHLIKTNQASLIQSAKDIEYLLGWQSPNVKKKQVIQKPIFVDLDPLETKIVEVLQVHQPIQLDLLGMKLNWPVSKVFPLLTMLELKGVVKGKPGRVFELT
jgi:DNA processing protein